MAAPAQILPDETLVASYDGAEPDFVDGQEVARSLPNNSHSKTQWGLVVGFAGLGPKFPLHGRPEIRLRVAPGRYRVADFALFWGEEPQGEVPAEPPLLIVEILSPDDAMSGVLEKFEDYRAWGAPHLFLADPATRRVYRYDNGDLRIVDAIAAPEKELRIDSAAIF